MFQFLTKVQIDFIVSLADKIASLLVQLFESGTFSIFVVI